MTSETFRLVGYLLVGSFLFFALLRWGIEGILLFLSAVLFACAGTYAIWRSALIRAVVAVAAERTWINLFREAQPSRARRVEALRLAQEREA
jgi:hypothetical protein